MNALDYFVVAAFFVGVLAVGLLSGRLIKSSDDYFVAGGRIPWWLSGISHHVSGYSGVVFVGYAGIAYASGTAIYFWWAVNIAVAMIVGALTIAPRWPRLRRSLGIQSPTEYLKTRYNIPAQVLVAVSGVVVKVLDVAAKWASIGILLHGFTGIPIWIGIIVASAITLVYMVIGGIMADLITDFAQFIVQVIAGIALFIGVVSHLSQMGIGFFSAFSQLPEGNLRVFEAGRGQGSFFWTLCYLVIIFLSYNGGTWNLAQRFISTTDDAGARKSAIFSGLLYLIWPLILFFPMFVGPIIFPGMDKGAAEATLYSKLTMQFLPNGLIGLVLASMFANTITMCNSDMNVISAVLTRDIFPLFKPSLLELKGRASLRVARLTTVGFTVATIIFALLREQLGGVTGMIITWFAALLGPTAIPLILGLLPAFKHSGSTSAILSVLGGFGVFVFQKATGIQMPGDIAQILPTAVSFAIFVLGGVINRARQQAVPEQVEQLMDSLAQKT